MSTQDDVLEFHQTYKCPIGNDGAKLPDLPTRGMRVNLMIEEYGEYIDGEDNHDIVEIADALADIVYIAYGTALTYGIDLDAVLAEVHKSNMSKLDADGNPIFRSDGKVLKGENYQPPRIATVLGI